MSAKEPPKTDHERRRGTTNADGELFADGVYPLLERRLDKSSARRLSCTLHINVHACHFGNTTTGPIENRVQSSQVHVTLLILFQAQVISK